jgi:hypothetical protein
MGTGSKEMVGISNRSKGGPHDKIQNPNPKFQTKTNFQIRMTETILLEGRVNRLEFGYLLLGIYLPSGSNGNEEPGR